MAQLLGTALCRYIPPVVGLTVDQLAADVGPTLQRNPTSPPPA
ncbi:hypothetical protein [Nocardia sp. alder85J]